MVGTQTKEKISKLAYKSIPVSVYPKNYLGLLLWFLPHSSAIKMSVSGLISA